MEKAIKRACIARRQRAMKRTGSAFSLLLLTMAAVSSGRNARQFFEEARLQHSPSRPDDALVFYVGNAPPLACEPAKGDNCNGSDPLDADFCLTLPEGNSPYTCTFQRSSTTHTDLMFLQNSVSHLFDFVKAVKSDHHKENVYCTNDSQLPDEYFLLRVQRPHEDLPLKCLPPKDNGKLHLTFPGYPTIVCQIMTDPFHYHHHSRVYEFNVPGIADKPLKCTFRVYSELPLADKRTNERLYKSLIRRLPHRVGGVRPRVVCSRQEASNGPAHFELQLKSGATYGCNFPDADPLLQTTPSP